MKFIKKHGYFPDVRKSKKEELPTQYPVAPFWCGGHVGMVCFSLNYTEQIQLWLIWMFLMVY